MRLTEISEKVFIDRYSLKDKKGKPLEKTPEEMWKRVSKATAALEKKEDQKMWAKEFYWAMEDFKYVPGGRILSGAGAGYGVSYYNCFVIPMPKDSRGGILETLKQMVEIMARSGGVGFNLSSLRPRGARVHGVNGFSSGPCNWAELFSVATRDIVQQGGSRRGALMLMLFDWHPDLEEFITVKQDLTKINGANLSVCVSDTFMEAVKKDADWSLVFPDKDDPEYDEKWNGDLDEWKALGKKVNVYKVVKARKIWDLIAEAAWKSAEPGVVFMERCNKYYNNWYWNKIYATNPCGEEPLPNWGVCNLGSINLSALVKGDNIDRKGRFDFKTLKRLVHAAVRLQDNVIDMDPYVFEGIRKTQLEGERRIGLGTMGLGDALIKLHLRYGSDEALEFIHGVYSLIRDEAYKASVEIAKEKGSFGKFEADKYLQGLFIKELPSDVRKGIKENGIRNSLLLMQAPTGTTSTLANTTSSGIEPVYEFEFLRKSRVGEFIVRHHLYEQWYKNHEQEIKEGKVKRPEWFVSANDLSPEDHVRVQGAIQKYVDASISKTVNAPNAHTVEDVKRLYTLAYELGLKGITYMREGSRQGVLERVDDKKKEEKKEEAPKQAVKPRPMVVHGSTYRMETPVGHAYITINTDENNEPLEVFINGVGKAGTDLHAMAEGFGRTISLCLRFASHMPPYERVKAVIDQIENIGGGEPFGFGKNRIRSLPDAVAKALRMRFLSNGHAKTADVKIEVQVEGSAQAVSTMTQPSLIQLQSSAVHKDLCPECGVASFVYEEGCGHCYGCGYSKC